ncbi:MAG: flagellar biosynthesis protein FliQ [Lachnospiraceae bacterium]|nr:flagellar biosynthesis protein FliQ [Lachnospiraceae bacterium]
MTTQAVVEIMRDALFLILEVSLPILLVSMIVGLIVSIFQTVTSIQEQTLTFVPKVVAIFTALMLLGNWMLTTMVEYTTQLWSSFSMYVHK